MGMTSYDMLSEKVLGYLDNQDWETPYSFLKDGIANGDAASMCLLGEMYYNGIGLQKDIEYAMNLYEKSALAGCGQASCLLGDIYSQGIDGLVEKNQQKSFQYYKNGADKDLPQAIGLVAGCYLWGEGVVNDDKTAFEYALKGSKMGDAWAMTITAICYQDGLGTSSDPFAAAHWYRESLCQREDTQSMYNLAVCLADPFENFGLSPSIEMLEEAYQWTCKAVELGNVDAHVLAAWFYQTGNCVAQNYDVSHHYLEIAANNGSEIANNVLKNYRRNIYGEWCI